MPFPDPLVTSAHFLRPGAVGPAEVRTEVVRAGRRVATGEARLVQDGREIVRAARDLRRPRAGRRPDAGARRGARAAAARRDARRAGGRRDARREHHRADRVPRAEAPRLGEGRAPDGEPSLEFWMRFRDGRDADPLALAALVDAAAPAVLDIGAPGSATIELTVHVRARPAPGWLACRDADAPRDRRLPRGGLRDLGLGRQPRGPVAPIRAASGVARKRFPQHAGSPG